VLRLVEDDTVALRAMAKMGRKSNPVCSCLGMEDWAVWDLSHMGSGEKDLPRAKAEGRLNGSEEAQRRKQFAAGKGP
jgi:hypothetical protein